MGWAWRAYVRGFANNNNHGSVKMEFSEGAGRVYMAYMMAFIFTHAFAVSRTVFKQ